MVPVITVHKGLTPLESDILLDTPGENACPTSSSRLARKTNLQSRLKAGLKAGWKDEILLRDGRGLSQGAKGHTCRGYGWSARVAFPAGPA